MLADERYPWLMRDPLVDLATVPSTPLPPAVVAARAPLATLVTHLLTLQDATLVTPWRWRATDPPNDEIDRRYGLYRIHERLESAIAAIAVGWEDGGGPAIGPAIPPLRAMATARWELHGLLAPLGGADWDADPGRGEWSIRQTLGHIIASQRSYSWYNAWFLRRRAEVGEAVRPAEGTLPPEPSEEAEASGTPTEVRARLDEVVDASISANAGLDRAGMRVGARWMGLDVPIDFRLGRYGSHIREHTVQVEKTLAMLGRQPTEVERLVRLILATYGRLEASFVGRSPAEVERAFADRSDAPSILASALTDVGETAGQLGTAAAAPAG
jgi:hypothetical protein